MELKYVNNGYSFYYASSYNCTFMELKFVNLLFIEFWHDTYNCTFMELKSIIDFIVIPIYILIIAPLWNWNFSAVEIAAYVDSYNCTFMELKLGLICEVEKVLRSYNCTFMELKSRTLARKVTSPDRL